MKKIVLIIYVIMIVVGIIGIFSYIKRSDTSVSQENSQDVPQEKITVAVARRDLEAKRILQADDFQIKDISIASGSAEKKLNITQPNLTDWALNVSVSSGDYIHPSMLVKPGSNDYLTMFLQPGNVLYTFVLNTSDNYLLTNLKPGGRVDIYLSYSLKSGTDGVNEIVSPSHSISESRLKPLMINKLVLAIRQTESVKKNGIEYQEKGSILIVELRDDDVKLLKGLEEKNAKIILFPAAHEAKRQTDGISTKTPLGTDDTSWPVSNEPIFKYTAPSQPTIEEVNQLRG